jgi:hypothetical protein
VLCKMQVCRTVAEDEGRMKGRREEGREVKKVAYMETWGREGEWGQIPDLLSIHRVNHCGQIHGV